MSAGSGDMFLMVKGAKHGLIKGEAQDDQHKGEIEVLSWSWGMQGRPTFGAGAAITGRSTINDLKIVKKIDSASTGLMLALRTNEVIQKAVLTLRKAGTSSIGSYTHKVEYLKVTIENGRVSSLTLEGGDSIGGADVVEKVGFSFNKIEVEYVPQGQDGNPLGGMSFQDQWSEQG